MEGFDDQFDGRNGAEDNKILFNAFDEIVPPYILERLQRNNTDTSKSSDTASGKTENYLFEQGAISAVLLADVVNIARDLGAIATSPEGKNLQADLKTFFGHLKGREKSAAV